MTSQKNIGRSRDPKLATEYIVLLAYSDFHSILTLAMFMCEKNTSPDRRGCR